MEALNIAVKIAQAVGAGINAAIILTKDRPTSEDKINACAQVVFACVQVGDLATPSDSSERIWTAGSAGVLDIVRSGTSLVARRKKEGERWKKSEIVQEFLLLTGTVVFRAGDVTRTVESFSNNAEANESCDQVISVTDAAGVAVNIVFCGTRICISFPVIKELCRRYSLKKKIEIISLKKLLWLYEENTLLLQLLCQHNHLQRLFRKMKKPVKMNVISKLI